MRTCFGVSYILLQLFLFCCLLKVKGFQGRIQIIFSLLWTLLMAETDTVSPYIDPPGIGRRPPRLTDYRVLTFALTFSPLLPASAFMSNWISNRCTGDNKEEAERWRQMVGDVESSALSILCSRVRAGQADSLSVQTTEGTGAGDERSPLRSVIPSLVCNHRLTFHRHHASPVCQAQKHPTPPTLLCADFK